MRRQTAGVQTRPLYEISREIRADWGRKVYFGAVPYLEAMGCLNSVLDDYGAEPGWEVVTSFLGNATTWQGGTARRVKAELKAMVGRY